MYTTRSNWKKYAKRIIFWGIIIGLLLATTLCITSGLAMSLINSMRNVPAQNTVAVPIHATGLTYKVTDKGVELSWPAVPGATQYVVERKAEGAPSFIELDRVTTPNYLDTSTTPSSHYTYRVNALTTTLTAPTAAAPNSEATPATTLSGEDNKVVVDTAGEEDTGASPFDK